MERAVIPPAKLYAIFDREFRALRPRECRQCRIPLPFWHESPDDVSANWLIGTPHECPHGCHLVIAELLARLWTRYDLPKDRPDHNQ